jgi:hypothetical protein
MIFYGDDDPDPDIRDVAMPPAFHGAHRCRGAAE